MQVEILPKFGESRYFLPSSCNVGYRHTLQQKAKLDILVSRHIVPHAEPSRQQCADASLDIDGAGYRRIYAGHYAQEGRLSGAIRADHSDTITVLQCQAHVFQRVKYQALAIV